MAASKAESTLHSCSCHKRFIFILTLSGLYLQPEYVEYLLKSDTGEALLKLLLVYPYSHPDEGLLSSHFLDDKTEGYNFTPMREAEDQKSH